ncbi:response regulator [Rhodohalobacter sp. SW132]|nr:response regulator [Rhodohalobacter sp. SW132]
MGILMILLPLILLAACTKTSGDRDASLPPPLYPQPQTVELKAGVSITATPKIIHPDSVAKPQSFIVDQAALTRINAHPNRRQIPNELTTIPIDQNQLNTIPLRKGNPDFVLRNSIGDTIPTGVPILAKGKVVKAIRSKPTKALPPVTKDAAIAHLQYLNMEQGLASSFVRAVLEDRSGNIWLGTRRGVSVYNGESFTHYSENEGLSNNFIRAIAEDQSGNIWLGTEGGGVSVFDGENFTHYTEREGFSNNLVRAILVDKIGNIWLGTRGGGVSVFNGESFTHYTENEGLSYNDVMSIAEDKNGNIWLGTFYGGVNVFDGESFTHYSENEGLSNSNVVSIAEDRRGNIWLGTDGGGVSVFNGESFTHYSENEGVSNRFVWSILEDKNGNIWLGTRGAGVSVFTGENFTHYTENEGLSNNTVFSITEDHSGNIWVGTEGGGVSVFTGENFTHYSENEGLSNNIVRAILEDQSGNIWLGTEGGGVSVFDGENFTHYTENDGLSNNDVISILEDQSGNIWLGTEGGGVSLFNGENFTHYSENEGVSNSYIRASLEDKSGNIWLGSRGRVTVFDGKSFIHYIDKEGGSNSVVWSILEDQSGNIWLGTEGGGVSVFDGENFIYYTENDGLSNNFVRTIAEDKSGNIWLGTWGGGISVFNGENFTHYTEKEGLSNNTVFSIIEDKSAPLDEVIVYIGTENGLSKISLKEDETSGDKEFAFSIQNFGKQDGLKGLRFTKGATIDSKNRAWWGTGNGLVMLDLNTLTFSDKIPQPRLSQLEINEQFIDYRNIPDSPDSDLNQITFSGVQKFENYPLSLQLPYDKNHLTFYFAAIDWAAPHKIRYSYRMEGLHTNWSQPTADPVADYRNLPFGSYTFQIRAIGESGVWSEPFNYSFAILPPWWHTWWAYGLYGFLFLSAIYSLRRYELTRFNLKNELQLERVEIDSLRKLDHLKSHFFANISHEFRTPLTLIIGQIETLLNSEDDRNRKKKLISVNNNAEQLLALINQLLDLSKLEAGKMEFSPEKQNIVSFLKNHLFSFESLAETKNISLNFTSARATIPVGFEADKMEKVFFNLFMNAFKFTEAGGRIDVSVETPQPDVVEIRVKDSGIGISKDRLPYIFDRFYQADPSSTRKYEGTGIGLALANELITLHSGTIDVESEEGVGTEFIIRLPFQEDHVSDSYDAVMNEHVNGENVSPASALPDFEALLSDHDELVLIVEDNDDVRSFIREQLENDYKILEAANGLEGIAVSQGTIPDLIITDLMMPEMDGYAFSEKIRSDEKTSHIPIIMLTAKAGLDPKIEGLEAGIDAWLTKPFHVKELQIRVKALIQQRKNLKQQFSTATYFKPSVIAKTPVDQSFLGKAIEMIDSHLCEESFLVEDFAASLNMSISQLNRKLNALVDQPAGNFIRSVRLQRSAELLNQTDKTIAEICYDVGFNDQAYFSRAFKKQFGKSPSAFRKLSI